MQIIYHGCVLKSQEDTKEFYDSIVEAVWSNLADQDLKVGGVTYSDNAFVAEDRSMFSAVLYTVPEEQSDLENESGVAGIRHLIPLDDSKDHIAQTYCDCNPRVEEQPDGSLLVIHNSFDDRLIMEEIEVDTESYSPLLAEIDKELKGRIKIAERNFQNADSRELFKDWKTAYDQLNDLHNYLQKYKLDEV